MTLLHLYESFSEVGQRIPAAGTGAAADEDPKLQALRDAAFESGYASGWDDGRASVAEQAGRIDAEFERVVQDLGFTYHEALEHLEGQYLDVIDAFLDALFPEMVPDLILDTVRNALLSQTEQLSPEDISLVAAPQTAEAIQALVDRSDRDDLHVATDESLAENQAFFRIKASERQMDFAALVGTVRHQLSALRSQEQPKVAHE